MKKVVTFVSIFLLVTLFFYLLKPDSFPPDLSDCTRIEIEFYPSALEYFFLENTQMMSVLSQDDKKYISSFDIIKVTDKELIKSFANEISFGTYKGGMKRDFRGGLPTSNYMNIKCYHDNKHIVSFIICGGDLFTMNRRHFEYPSGSLKSQVFLPPELLSLVLRGRCAFNMETLSVSAMLFRDIVSSYPEPNQWCDAIVTDQQAKHIRQEKIFKPFLCPGVSAGKSDLAQSSYAMNPNCEPNSPKDMVLLFEAKAGWNQCGGAELFTFDNHDPNGGCVLLNDGTVKFIRTKKELQSLKWK